MPIVGRAVQKMLHGGRWPRVVDRICRFCTYAMARSSAFLRTVKNSLGFGSQFQLLRSFSLSSAMVMMLVTAALVSVYHSHQTATLLRVAEDQNATLARSFANTVWARHAGFLTSIGHLRGDAIRARPETAELDGRLRQITKGLPVLKIKIFDLNGLTVYSSEASQIGESRSDNQGFLKAARTGAPASKMSFRGAFSAFSGVLANVDLAESYVPIVDDAGRVMSVFELYTDITPHVASMRRDSWSAAVLCVIASAVIYLVLLLVVRRADTIIKRQQAREISSVNAMLDSANAKIDVALRNM